MGVAQSVRIEYMLKNVIGHEALLEFATVFRGSIRSGTVGDRFAKKLTVPKPVCGLVLQGYAGRADSGTGRACPDQVQVGSTMPF
jgi:hypothetical protein